MGTVYELAPSNGGWTENVLWTFSGGNDGGKPAAGVILDDAGNLYGTTQIGGTNGFGSVFQLAPAGSSWLQDTVYSFQNGSDGANPASGLIFDPSGSLYGTATSKGQGGGGTAFKLTPQNGTWAFSVLYAFAGQGGGGPQANMTMDAAGNLYGTTYKDGAYGSGSAFRLTPSNGGWTYTDLHDFTSGGDGANPVSNTILDADGNLYGTAFAAGNYGDGVVFKIIPLLITTTSLPPGTVNNPYSATLSVTGGVPPYTWSIIKGGLPAGLSLDANSGVISGTPTTAGTSNFTVQVSDSESPPALTTAPLSITINAHSVFLSWDASSSQDVIGYNAYRGTNSGGPYTKLNSSLIPSTSYTDQTVLSGYTYYYVTTAIDSQGLESAYSNQAVATVP
jgi:uncharacterized repeat protein (TIGR03803 family)